MKISECIDSIQNNDLVIPEFQREYVWSKDQAKMLFSSLARDYPVGGLLFWKTNDPPELKNIDKLPSKLGAYQVVLDGQQRLTTLFLLITGRIPPYYKEADILTDPRDLYFNLATGEFQYYQPNKMKNEPVWCSVVQCFDADNINVFDIAKQVAENNDVAFKLANDYTKKLTKLRNINNISLPVQIVPSTANLDEAITIFDLVNRQGTKLTDADLALTHITGKWSEARRVMKKKMSDLDKKAFDYDLNFMTRAITSVVTGRALFEAVHEEPREKLELGWKNLSKVLDYLSIILPEHAFIHSTNDVNSTSVFIPLIFYISRNDNKFPNLNSINHAIHWLYAAHIWQRYTSQTDQRLEGDLSIIKTNSNPWDALCAQIIDQRGRLDVKRDDLEGRGKQHPFYRMTYILSKAMGATDWFNGASLRSTDLENYSIHSHHIFPLKQLEINGYDAENLIHRTMMNEIANRAFLTADTNLEIAYKPPEEYLPIVEEKYPGTLKKQFIPMDTHLWKMNRYPDFLVARREIIANKINEYLKGLITVPQIVHARPISELIKLGESATLEFKSTLQWDVVQNRQNNGLRKQVLKTIVAFLNSDGGTLVIGVEDDGTIYGLQNDLKIVGNSTDKFSNLLATLISDEIGAEYSVFIKSRIEALNDHKVCAVDVFSCSSPAYIKGEKGKEFYIRFGPTSRLLDTEETVKYIEMKWS